MQPGTTNNRPVVYVVGGKLVADSFLDRGLTMATASPGVEPALQSDARAVVFVAGDLGGEDDRHLARWAARTVKPALDRGTACMVITGVGQEGRARMVLAAADPHGRIEIRDSINGIAHSALLHDPGAFPGPTPVVHAPRRPRLSEELELLLKRAFHQFQEVRLTHLPGGRSGAQVWRVECVSADRDVSSPFVVKFGPRAKIREELGTYRNAVADRIPFRGCAPICVERSVEGSTNQVLVSRFVERAERLDILLKQEKALDAEALVSGIYDGPLHRWRSHTTTATLKLFDELCDRHVRSSTRGLRATWLRLGGNDSGLPPPTDLIAKLSAVEWADVPICHAHDDLNLRNVFVAEPQSDVVLIDFTRSKKRPLSRDIARLDVALGFDVELQGSSTLPNDLLEEFYAANHFRPSLLHPSDCPKGQARLEMVQALRRRMVFEARRESYDPTVEYSVAVAAELLYHARRKDQSADAAYRCAGRIAVALAAAVDEGDDK